MAPVSRLISSGGRWPRLCQAWCGRDARAPGKAIIVRAGRPRSPGSHHPMTSSHQGHQIAEAFWRRLWLKQVRLSFVSLRVHSCPFVVRLY